jgi:hypothetical protein
MTKVIRRAPLSVAGRSAEQRRRAGGKDFLYWYDRRLKLWTLTERDEFDNQKGEADYYGTRAAVEEVLDYKDQALAASVVETAPTHPALLPLKVTALNATQVSAHHYLADASDLGLAPGAIPLLIHTDLGNGQAFLLTSSPFRSGPLRYAQANGILSLEVADD